MSKANVKFPSAPDTSAIDVQDEGSVIVSNPTALNFTGPGVTVTENPSGTAEVDIPGLQYWTESEDAATQQSTIFTPNNGATNVNAVLLPKGNGANLAQTPDGTNTGGNARGVYATDWQKERSAADQVASGSHSTISGGTQNKASQTYSSVIGGLGNNATALHAIAGARQNTASGEYSLAIGRSVAASGVGSVALGFNGNATAHGAFRTGLFGGSMPYSNGVLHGGTVNTPCGYVLVPLSFFNIDLAAGATTTKTIDLDLIYTNRGVFGIEVSSSVYIDSGSPPSPLTAYEPLFQKDLFCVSATNSATCSISGIVINAIKQGGATMVTGGISYSISGTVLTITFTAPSGYSGTVAYNAQINLTWTFCTT